MLDLFIIMNKINKLVVLHKKPLADDEICEQVISC